MRKRNNRVQIRMNDEEYNEFTTLVIKSGVTKETYMRHLINGVVPNDKPPPDYYAMMKTLYGIGNNLNQIAQKAHRLNVIDVQRYDEIIVLHKETLLNIAKAVILPQRFR